MPCFWDVGVLVEVIGPIRLHYQVRGHLPKQSVMEEGAGQKLAAQELVIQLDSWEVTNITAVSGLSKLLYQVSKDVRNMLKNNELLERMKQIFQCHSPPKRHKPRGL